MAKSDKVAAVAELVERFRAADAVLLTEYRGLTVGQLKQLRRGLGENATYAVAKNTLARLAAKEVGLDFLAEDLKGPTAIAFVSGEPVEAAKTLRDFAKDNPALVLKSGAMDGAPRLSRSLPISSPVRSCWPRPQASSRPRLVRRRSHSTLCPSRQCAPSMLCAKSSRARRPDETGHVPRRHPGCVKLPNNLHSCRPIRKDATHG